MYLVYTKDNCQYCDMAKALLTQQGEDFQTIKLGEGITREELIAKIPTARTMPQIIKSDSTSSVYIGGYTELKQFLHAA